MPRASTMSSLVDRRAGDGLLRLFVALRSALYATAFLWLWVWLALGVLTLCTLYFYSLWRFQAKLRAMNRAGRARQRPAGMPARQFDG